MLETLTIKFMKQLDEIKAFKQQIADLTNQNQKLKLEKEVQKKEQKSLVEHIDVTCTICNGNPLQGTRYICLTCENMNICENCELQQVQHSKIHAMIVVSVPELAPPSIPSIDQL